MPSRSSLRKEELKGTDVKSIFKLKTLKDYIIIDYIVELSELYNYTILYCYLEYIFQKVINSY